MKQLRKVCATYSHLQRVLLSIVLVDPYPNLEAPKNETKRLVTYFFHPFFSSQMTLAIKLIPWKAIRDVLGVFKKKGCCSKVTTVGQMKSSVNFQRFFAFHFTFCTFCIDQLHRFLTKARKIDNFQAEKMEMGKNKTKMTRKMLPKCKTRSKIFHHFNTRTRPKN